MELFCQQENTIDSPEFKSMAENFKQTNRLKYHAGKIWNRTALFTRHYECFFTYMVEEI
jgi:hypothetical protein